MKNNSTKIYCEGERCKTFFLSTEYLLRMGILDAVAEVANDPETPTKDRLGTMYAAVVDMAVRTQDVYLLKTLQDDHHIEICSNGITFISD